MKNSAQTIAYHNSRIALLTRLQRTADTTARGILLLHILGLDAEYKRTTA